MSQGPEKDDLPFSGLEPPAPPAALRGQVLKSTRDALAREVGRDVWTRIWESRPLRLAWAAATLLLVAAHLVVSARTPLAGRREAALPSAPAADPAGELSAVAGLSPLNENLLPRLEAPASAPAAEPGTAPAAPSRRNRKESAS